MEQFHECMCKGNTLYMFLISANARGAHRCMCCRRKLTCALTSVQPILANMLIPAFRAVFVPEWSENTDSLLQCAVFQVLPQPDRNIQAGPVREIVAERTGTLNLTHWKMLLFILSFLAGAGSKC